MENENEVNVQTGVDLGVTEVAADLTAEPEAASNGEGDSVALSADEVERLVTAAEERGYLRGRNESVEALMDRPAGGCHVGERVEEDDDEDAVMILREMRRSVWDG